MEMVSMVADKLFGEGAERDILVIYS